MTRLLPVVVVFTLVAGIGPVPVAAVVGGSAPTGRWQFTSALIRPGNGPVGPRQACGAALIAPTWAVTAAHCTEPLAQPGGLILIGRADLVNGADGDLRGIKSVHVNPSWSKATQLDDIALVELDMPATVPPITTMAADAEPLWDGSPKGTIIGWGATSTPRSTPKQFVLAANVPVFSEPACRAAPAGLRFDPKKLLCGGDRTASACHGDSGGPLVTIDAKGQLVVAGLSSFGPPVCGESPSFYTRLAGYTAWIQSVTGVDPTIPVVSTTTTTVTTTPPPTATTTTVTTTPPPTATTAKKKAPPPTATTAKKKAPPPTATTAKKKAPRPTATKTVTR